MREIKFNAWIKELNLMVYDIVAYSDGLIGMTLDDFEEYINGLPEHIQFIDDGVYYADEDRFDLLLSVLSGDDYIWIDNTIRFQFTGLHDKNGIEIFESDIIQINHPFKNRKYKGVIEFLSGRFMIRDYYAPHQDNPTDFIESIEYAEVIGNIHENKDLL